MPNRRAIMAVRGTQYYQAVAEYQAGRLKAGSALRLVRERGNPHDQFAILVKQAITGANLGHVGRGHAAKYSSLLDLDAITSAQVKNAYRRTTGHLTIEFVVEYHDEDEDRLSLKYTWHSQLEHMPAVYEIRQISSGCSYIGSAQDVKARARQHERDLSRREHHNAKLQADFDKGGATAFAFTIVRKSASRNLRTEEANELHRRRSSSMPLYNSTDDGEGKMPLRESQPPLTLPTHLGPASQPLPPQMPFTPPESEFHGNTLWIVAIIAALVLMAIAS
jgi:predicted GIY-YIG superfamily endonuclease